MREVSESKAGMGGTITGTLCLVPLSRAESQRAWEGHTHAHRAQEAPREARKRLECVVSWGYRGKEATAPQSYVG